MPGTSTRLLAAGAALAALCAAAGPACARQSLLVEDATGVGAALSAGLVGGDALYQGGTDASALPKARRWALVPAASVWNLSPADMAETLRGAMEQAPGKRVVIDDVGPAWGGARAAALHQAIDLLQLQRSRVASGPLSRRVNLILTPDAGTWLTDSGLAQLREAIVDAGAVWLETSGWSPTAWLTWPADTVRLLASHGLAGSRAHVLMAPGDQSAAWTRARAGSACGVLSSGPGTYRLGAAAADWGAQFRSTFPRGQGSAPAQGCTTAPVLPAAGASALASATAGESSGLPIPPGGLVTPPLVAGEPAQVTLSLGADPLGLAAGLGVAPETLWNALGALVQVRGAGVSADVPVAGDGSVPLLFTPTSAGPLTLTLVVPGAGIHRALGATADLVDALAAAPGGDALLTRVVAAPDTWSLAVPLRPTNSAPGDPALVIVAAP